MSLINKSYLFAFITIVYTALKNLQGGPHSKLGITPGNMRDRLNELMLANERESTAPKHAFFSQSNLPAPSKWYDKLDKDTIKPQRPVQFTAQKTHVTLVSIKETYRTNFSKKKKTDSFLDDLKMKIQCVECLLEKIRVDTRELTALHTKALMSLSIADSDRAQMTEVEMKSKKVAAEVSKRIKDLENTELPQVAIQQRIYSTQIFHLRKSYTGLMERLRSELQRYAKGLRDRLAQEISIAKGDSYDAADLEQCISDGSFQIFIDNYQSREKEEKEKLQDVCKRHSDLLAVEKTITEVHSLFKDLANLIAQQGECIDTIEAHVLAAASKTESGRRQLKKAKKKQKSARKKKIALAGVGAAVSVILVATLVIL